MSRRWSLLGFLSIICLCYGGWLLARNPPDRSAKSGNQTAIYSLCQSSNGDLLFDSQQGKTWVLRKLENGDPVWLPIPRIDSEKEAAKLWRKSADYAAKVNKKEQSLPINKISEESPSIDKMLRDRGYVEIALNRVRTGYFGIDLRIEGKKAFLLVDTGAPATALDRERVKHLQLKWQPWENDDGKEKAKGKGKEKAAQAYENFYCEISKLELGGIDTGHLALWSHDLSDLNKRLKLYLDPQFDGVLGSDVLTKFNAIIDFSTSKLYLHPPGSQERKQGK